MRSVDRYRSAVFVVALLTACSGALWAPSAGQAAPVSPTLSAPPTKANLLSRAIAQPPTAKSGYDLSAHQTLSSVILRSA